MATDEEKRQIYQSIGLILNLDIEIFKGTGIYNWFLCRKHAARSLWNCENNETSDCYILMIQKCNENIAKYLGILL